MTFEVGDRVDPATLVQQRWFAAPGVPIQSITIQDRFQLPGGGALAILRIDAAGGRVLRRSMPIESGDGRGPWLGLLELVSTTGVVRGEAGGSLTGHPEPGTSGVAGHDVRPLGKDQSHTSVVIDEAILVKLYRALSPGVNTEVELGQALLTRPSAPVPRFRGHVRVHLERPDGQHERTVVAFVQDFVPDAGDAFEDLADRLAAWLRAGAPNRAVPSLVQAGVPAGLAAARLHGALAGVGRRSFVPRDARVQDVDWWRRRAALAHRTASRRLRAVDPGRASWLAARHDQIQGALTALASPAPHRIQRIHADLHLGQLLRAGDGFLVADLEGEPGRPVAERRRLDLPLRDVASMLRSFDHVGRSGMRRSGVPIEEVAAGTSPADAPIDAWLVAIRSAFLDAYAAEAGTQGHRLEIDRSLLHTLEVEKELYEFSYAATYLPTWMYAPAAGMRWLLDRGPA